MRRGFTLFELVITFGIMLAVAAVVFANFATKKTNTDLTATTLQIVTLLHQAQSNAMAQEDDASWGVHFANTTATAPFYALFTTSYSPSSVVSGPYQLPTTVAYTLSTLASGATRDVIFSEMSGVASVSTTIGLYLPDENAAFSSTIEIASSGEVGY